LDDYTWLIRIHRRASHRREYINDSNVPVSSGSTVSSRSILTLDTLLSYILQDANLSETERIEQLRIYAVADEERSHKYVIGQLEVPRAMRERPGSGFVEWQSVFMHEDDSISFERAREIVQFESRRGNRAGVQVIIGQDPAKRDSGSESSGSW
jgi:hypothetical protein